MNYVKEIIRGEITKLFQDKQVLLSGIAVTLIWTFIAIPTASSEEVASVANVPLFISTAVGVFIIYLLSTYVFINEKRQKSIETLLCTPVNLREVWLGKSITVMILAYSASLMSALIIFIGTSVLQNSIVIPEISFLAYQILITPIFFLALTGLVGLFEFIFGMKENRILNFGFFFLIMFFFGFVNSLVTQNNFVSWLFVGIAAVAALLLLGLSFYLVKFISKEKIVTTLE
ncbi:MAG: ABC transporter permease [Candidatus Woesearchaeota archaeon]